MNPNPDISTRKPLPLVWIVPVIALLVGGFLLFREVAQKGPVIHVVFNDGSGLEAGKTNVLYKGLKIGLVESVSLTEDLSKVKASIQLQNSAKGLAREGSKFWILRPKVGLGGVSGLDTILSGPTIQVAPGVGRFAKEFAGLDRAPLEGSDIGYDYVLLAKELGSLKVGSPVLFREFKVGEISEIKLGPDAREIHVKISVNAPYDKLVRADSVFWNASGIAMKVGLLGAKVHTNSLESVLSGGVMFATPEQQNELAELAPSGTHFTLHKEHREEWLKWEASIPLE